MSSRKSGLSLDRRQLLKVSVGGTAALWLGLGEQALAANGGVKVSWYGGQDTHERMQKALKLFTEKNPDIPTTVEFAPFNEFWDRLPVQYAGGGAPDMHRHSMTYLYSYIKRGLLADLAPYIGSTIDISKLYPGVVDIGTMNGKTNAIGNNQIAFALFYNKEKLDKAGVTGKLDNLTWDGFREISIALGKAGGNQHYGTNDSGGVLAFLELFVTQRGKSLYAENALGFEQQDLVDWFAFWQSMRDEQGAPPPAITSESTGFQNAPMVRDMAAMQTGWCQQLVFFQALMKQELGIHACPSPAEGPDNGHLIRALDFWAVPARSKNVDKAAKLIDFLLNDEEAIEILGLTLGGPASDKASDILSKSVDKTSGMVLDYLKGLRAHASKKTPGWIAGHGELESLLKRLNESIGFAQTTPKDAADEFFSQAVSILR